MKAIFPGTCAACSRAIQRGDELVDSGRRGPRGGKIMVHAGCSARKNPMHDEGLVRCIDCGSVVPDEAMAEHTARHRADRAFQHRGPARPATKRSKTRRDDATWWVTGQTGPVMHRDTIDVAWRKNPKSLMIPLPFPESAYRYGPDPDLASWTVDPEYSYQQFARENPGVFRVTGRAIPVPANHPYARRLQDQLRAKMNAERFSTPAEAQTLLAEVKASYLFVDVQVIAQARKNFFWGKGAEKKVERRVSGAERELMEFRDRVQAEIHKLEGEAKQTAMVREALEDRRSLLSHLDGRLSEFARPNGLGRPVYSEVPHNAGPYVPQMYPFGSFGRPATYTTEPPKAKKNPRRKKR